MEKLESVKINLSSEDQEKVKLLRGEFVDLQKQMRTAIKSNDIYEMQIVLEWGRKLSRRILSLESGNGDIESIETSLEQAEKIMGEDLLGPDAIKNAFDIEIKKIPTIPFSESELERAKELGQMLVLRVSETAEGRPLSIFEMNKLVKEKWEKDDTGKLLWEGFDWTERFGEELTDKTTPHPGWTLTSKEIISDSTSKNYLEQTEQLVTYLKEEVFKDQEMPAEYQEAIEEFQSQKDELTDLTESNWQEAAKRLSQLEINKLCRGSMTDTIYDILVHHNENKERLLENKYTWTNTISPDGFLVSVGEFDSAGVYGDRWFPDFRDDDFGVCFSRSV
jgi:hypothetical protein